MLSWIVRHNNKFEIKYKGEVIATIHYVNAGWPSTLKIKKHPDCYIKKTQGKNHGTEFNFNRNDTYKWNSKFDVLYEPKQPASYGETRTNIYKPTITYKYSKIRGSKKNFTSAINSSGD